MMNAVIAGNLGKDAETRQAGNTTVTNFGVAVEQRDRNGKTTTWVRCALWGKRGETLAQYLTKGSKVCVSGSLSTREHEGKTYLELNASDVTLMGGGQQQSQQRPSSGPSSYRDDRQAAPAGNIDDEIPF